VRAALLILLVASCGGRGAAAAAAHHRDEEPDHPAVHGMLLFGERQLFLSHLPLFHAPHDYQVILAAELRGGADPSGPLARYLADRQQSGEVVYTFVPERFRLPDLAFPSGERPAPFRFHGEVVRGHFERGGTEIDRGVEVTPRVIFAEKLQPAGKVAGASYLLFGTREEAYLAHLVTGPPDFDQILAVEPPKGVADADLRAGARLTSGIPGRPLPPSGSIRVTFDDGRAATLRVRKQIYLESRELAE
jgi:hypothetical protein